MSGTKVRAQGRGRARSRKRLDSRVWLTGIWFALFVINCTAIAWLYYAGWIGSRYFSDAIFQLNAMYTPYVGATLAYYLRTRSATQPPIAATSAPFVVAMATTVVWNAFVCAEIGQLFRGQGGIEESLPMLRNVTGVLSWLVAPSSGF